MRAITTLFAALLASSSAFAEASLTSVYSGSAYKSCPNDFNRPLSQLGDHQAITYLCKGISGYLVDITFWGNYVTATFRRGGKKNEGGRLATGYSVGDQIEWRGDKGPKGFEPRAAILRLRSRDDNGRLGDVLGIVRVDGDKACPAAFIDAGSNPKANEMARRAADESATGPGCANMTARIVGVATERAQESLDRSR